MRRHEIKILCATLPLLAAASVLLSAVSTCAQAPSAAPGTSQPTILYGAAYYNEYMPADLQPGRLDKDVALMKAAGITVAIRTALCKITFMIFMANLLFAALSIAIPISRNFLGACSLEETLPRGRSCAARCETIKICRKS